jgi:hypothetical protein
VPDSITPVGTMYPPQNPIAALSSIYGIQQQQLALQQGRQNLQTGQYAQQSAQAGAQLDQQKASEMQAVGNLTKGAYTSGRYTKPDGTFDNNKFANDVNAVAPVNGQAISNAATERAGRVFDNQQKLFNLEQSKREAIGNMAGAVAADATTDPTKATNAVENLRSQFPDDKDLSRVLTSMTMGMKMDADPPDPKNPNAPSTFNGLRQQFRNIAVGVNAPSASQTTPATDTYQGASGVQPYQKNPQAVGGIKNIGVPLGPQGITPQVVTTPSGSLQVWGPNGPGGKGAAPSSGQSGPRTAAQDAPPPNAPKQVQDAYQQAVAGTNTHVDAVRTADESYGNNMAISNAVRELSKGANTGPGTETWNHVMGALGTTGGNNAQELGAFLDRQAATVRGQMGLPGTNAGAEDAKSIVGNTGYNPKVIQDKNDYTQALTEGLHQYRNGLDRVAGFSGQASPTAVNQYKSAWAQNFDPNIYKGELAYKRSKTDGDAFVRSLPPQEAASLSAKRVALQKLSQGQIPQ